MDEPSEISVNEVTNFLLTKGGSCSNHELVYRYKKLLNHPSCREEMRQRFRDVINTVAIVYDEQGMKHIKLREQYNDCKNYEQDEASNIENYYYKERDKLKDNINPYPQSYQPYWRYRLSSSTIQIPPSISPLIPEHCKGRNSLPTESLDSRSRRNSLDSTGLNNSNSSRKFFNGRRSVDETTTYPSHILSTHIERKVHRTIDQPPTYTDIEPTRNILLDSRYDKGPAQSDNGHSRPDFSMAFASDRVQHGHSQITPQSNESSKFESSIAESKTLHNNEVSTPHPVDTMHNEEKLGNGITHPCPGTNRNLSPDVFQRFRSQSSPLIIEASKPESDFLDTESFRYSEEFTTPCPQIYVKDEKEYMQKIPYKSQRVAELSSNFENLQHHPAPLTEPRTKCEGQQLAVENSSPENYAARDIRTQSVPVPVDVPSVNDFSCLPEKENRSQSESSIQVTVNDGVVSKEMYSVRERAKRIESLSSRETRYRSFTSPRSRSKENLNEKMSEDSISIASLDPKIRKQWFITSAQCDYLGLIGLLKKEPRLAGLKDIASGFTALHWAAKHGNADVIKLMAGTHKINPDVKSHGGYTSIHIATLYKHKSIVDLLLRTYGADPTIRDNSGKRADQYPENFVSFTAGAKKKPLRTVAYNGEVPSSCRINNAVRSLDDDGVHTSGVFLRIGSLNLKAARTKAAVFARGTSVRLKAWNSEDSVSEPLSRDIAAKVRHERKKKTKKRNSEMTQSFKKKPDSDSDSAYGFY